jgi:hypothetical protein
MNHANTIVWIALLIMTIVNYAMGEKHVAASLILGVAGLKFALVAWQFMELRRVHRLWSVMLGGLLVLILAVAMVLK